MLHFLQFVLYPIQSVDTFLEVAGEVREQGRDLRIFEVLKLRDDVLTFFAGLHPVDQALEALAT